MLRTSPPFAASLLLVLILPTIQTAAQKPAAPAISLRVDPRVELICIVFRLAGHPEYSDARVTSYAQAVDRHFAPFRDHPVIRLARQLRASRSISYDACMSLAVHLTDDGKFQELIPLDPQPPSLDARWTTAHSHQFLEQLQDFASQSDFAAFFDQQRPLHDLAVTRMRQLLDEQAHLDWFPAFFGARPTARFQVVLAPLNGPSNYGVHCRLPDGAEQLYAILGIWSVDAQDQPAFGPRVLPTLVHEFTHSYTNPLIDRFEAQLRPAGVKLFAPVATAMSRQAYGTWTTMLRETLVRACTLRYVSRHQGPVAATAQSLEELARGFSSVPPLANLLATYEDQRQQYPTLEAFMPRIIELIDEQAANLPDAADTPQVVSTTPANGDRTVDPALVQIRVVFDRPMKDQSWSLVGGLPTLPQVTGKPSYNPARTTWTVPVHLEPGTDYQFQLNSDRFQGFQTEQGIPLPPLTIGFRTAPLSP